MTTTMNTTTTDAKTDAKPKAMNANTLAALVERAAAVQAAETTGYTSIEEARWTALESLTSALATLGTFVVGSVIPKASSPLTSGEAIRKAMADKTSGIYIPSEMRKEVPSGSVLSRAMTLAAAHSSARLTEYREATDAKGNRNTAKVEDYAQWLNILMTGKVGNRSKVDLEAMTITGKGKARKVGPLVRVASAKTNTTKAEPTAATVVGFFADILKMSGEELASLVEDGPIDIESIPAARRRDVARQLMASVTLAELTDKIVVTVK